MTPEQALSILISAIGVLLCGVMTWIATNLNRLTNSVEKLNIQMALVGEKVNTHQWRIERLEEKRRP